LGVFFSQIDTEIRADQSALRNLMRRLSVEESSLRQAGAWAAEKVGRVRLMIAGGEQAGLGLVLTLEGLIMGIIGKKLLWRSLAAANLAGLNGYDFRELERRTELKPNGLEQRSSCSQMGLAWVDGRDADTRKNGQETEA
jgi:hypothetical protein